MEDNVTVLQTKPVSFWSSERCEVICLAQERAKRSPSWKALQAQMLMQRRGEF